MTIDLQNINNETIHIPPLMEIWQWEGDVEPLPEKWCTLIHRAFGTSLRSDQLLTPATFMEKYVSQPQFRKDGFFFLTSRSTAVGTAFAWTDQENEKTTGRLHWVAVDPDYQRLGVGTALVKLVLKYFHANDFLNVVLTTEATRTGAIKLYEQLGFVRR